MTDTAKKAHGESHLLHRSGWLRAAVLGANDGILSIGSIVSGMAAGGAPRDAVLLAALAALVAGATSMATGEYVSVSSQSDTERADLQRESRELTRNPVFEHEELAQIYVGRGLDEKLAREVATQLMAHDAIGAHARDELGITEITAARPMQAALASAASFIMGGLLPLMVAVLSPLPILHITIIASTLLSLAVLGVTGAYLGGVKPLVPAVRVVAWGIVSVGLTMLAGKIFGAVPA